MDKDQSKQVTVQLKDIIRELQMLQGGNRALLQDYKKAGEDLSKAIEEKDQETIDYLKEFRKQAQEDLKKTVTEKFGGDQKIDPLVLKTALAAAGHLNKEEDKKPRVESDDNNEVTKELQDVKKTLERSQNTDVKESEKTRKGLMAALKTNTFTIGKKLGFLNKTSEKSYAEIEEENNRNKKSPLDRHREHQEVADPKQSGQLSPQSFSEKMSKIMTNFFGGPGKIRERYNKGNYYGRATVAALASLPLKMAGVFERLPFVSGLTKFFKGFFDTIGSALAAVGAIVSLSGFLSGWEKAKDWFGENADFWDKLSSGLAGIAQAFLGLDEKSAKDLAMKISNGVHGLINFVQGVFTATWNVIQVVWKDFGTFIGGFRKIWDGIVNGNFTEIFSGIKDLGKVVADVAKAIWDNKLALIPIFYFFSGAILTALTAIGGIVGGIASVLGGAILSAFTSIGSIIITVMTPIVAAIAPILAGIAAGLLVFKGLLDGILTGIEEYKKSGSVLSAIKAGVLGFGKSVVDAISAIWNAVIEALADVVELIPWKGKDIANSIRSVKVGDSTITGEVSKTVTGVQSAYDDLHQNAIARNEARNGPPVVINNNNVSNSSNTSAMQPAVVTESGSSYKYR